MPELLPSYAILFVGIVFGVIGQLLLKTGAVRSTDTLGQFIQPFTIVGLGFYVLAAACYIIAIKRIPLSLAFPTVSLSYIVVAVAAHYLWNEHLGPSQFGGMALIFGGILLLHLNRV
jgi:multidrug transporter EmrE-like cation transporter